MNKKICEVVPYTSFKEKIAITKKLTKEQQRNAVDLGNCFLIYCNTKKRCFDWYS